MRQSGHGLHKGARIHVIGMTGNRRHANGTISREPDAAATYVFYFCDFNSSEHVAQIGKVKRLREQSARKREAAS